jgi:bifunctional polynucleotide phosphatase/kinase
MPTVPFRLLAATSSDGFRKPLPGMWWQLEKIYAEGNATIGVLSNTTNTNIVLNI